MSAPSGEMHLFHGLLWSPAWFFEHEGPYTKLAKVSLINLANSKTLNRNIFNATDITWDAEIVHGRSLIYTHWMSQIASAKACDNLASALQRSSWLPADGSDAMQMATDKHFRYCPACLDIGFQSSLMQIVGLDKCPVHALQLRDRCMHCNALCPRYAVCRDAFEQPMRCVKCGRLYARAWAPGGLVSSWKGVEDGTGFIRVENWIQRAGNLVAPKLRAPEMRELQIEQQRRVIFDFLRQEVPLDLSVHRPSTVRRSNGLVSQLPPFDGHSELLARRVGIYKSVRRHFERVLGIKKLWRVERSFNDLEQGFLDLSTAPQAEHRQVCMGFFFGAHVLREPQNFQVAAAGVRPSGLTRSITSTGRKIRGPSRGTFPEPPLTAALGRYSLCSVFKKTFKVPGSGTGP